MKKLMIIALTLLASMTMQAQMHIPVDYQGQKPNIKDFVSAILSQHDLGEALNDVKSNWQLYLQKKPLSQGASFSVDVKNGFVRYEHHYTPKTYGYTEFCFWNCQDPAFKLVAVNNGFMDELVPTQTQYSGLDFYTYFTHEKYLNHTPAKNMGAGIEVSHVVAYTLPQTGKDIMATIFAPQRNVQILMKWNGMKFQQQQLGAPDGNVQVSARPAGNFGETVKYKDDTYIRVHNAEQFLNALGSKRNILVARNTELNLTPIVSDQNYFLSTSRKWLSVVNQDTFKGGSEVIVSEEVNDGRQLTLVNMKQLTIEGEGNSSIVVDPRYSFCLRFVACDQCSVNNLTIGHTEGGYCEGGVIGITGGWRNTVMDCDLYGCGTYGLDIYNTNSFSMYSSKIRDCTYGIMNVRNSLGVHFTHCDFFRNQEYSLVDAMDVEGLVFEDCRFYANWGDATLFSCNKEFYLLGCAVYHPTEHLGNMDLCQQPAAQNFFSPNPLDLNIKGREIGPDGHYVNARGE